MILNLACDLQVNLKLKGSGAGYRPEITSARVPKWSQATASLSWEADTTITFDLAFYLQRKTEG